MPIDGRCSGLEKFLQSINILCKYAHNRCIKTMPYSKKIEHEQVCQHVTCFCPYPSCSFAYSPWSLYRHFDVQHPLSATRFTYNTTFSVSVEINQKQIFLQERRGSVVFILHHEVQQHGGRAFYVDCVGLKSTLKNMFVYHLAAESMDMDTSLTFKSVPEVHTQLPKHTFMKSYLTVPSMFAGDNGILSLSVCIIKDDPAALEVQEGELGMHDRDAHKVLKVVLNDPAAFDCSICLKPLWTPVFQCENAHLACSSCCSKLKSKCSCCGYNYNRCRGLEKVIESIDKISCKYAKYGCKETKPYNEKTEHEKDCRHAICFCPHPSSCSFAGPYENLYLHFGIKHAADITRFTYNTTFSLCVDINQEHIFLQEQSGSVILILSHQLKKQGRVFYIDCVGTRALKNHIVYRLTAKSMETSRTLKCVPNIYTKWSKHNEPRKNHLTVPPDFAGYDGTLSLSICITEGVEALSWILFGDD
ncbi:Aminotransferase-like mobile domain-containing protein [Artemisia annua]|uniref:Aminotransferase-like mobile domain-containing protein n=1 Tax=Artemisia annua TaxID=35608 RepID=A0A2U1MPK1_ARTAN|nr:Aminotransferase-like mobile domain-containing protein [Artemisia annua]